MAKRTPSEVWADIEDDVLRAEAERIEALTPEEARRELEDAGFDLDKVHADAERIFEMLREGGGESPLVDESRGREGETPRVEGREFSLLRDAERTAERGRREMRARESRRALSSGARAAWLLAAALGCAVIGFFVWRAVAPSEEARKEPITPKPAAPETAAPPTPAPPPSSAPAIDHLPTPRELREQAVRACEDERWDDCLRAFNRAREMDPKGDEDPVVQRWRRTMMPTGRKAEPKSTM